MSIRKLIYTTVPAILLLAGASQAATIDGDAWFFVVDAEGSEAPPPYMLRMDKAIPGSNTVTWATDGPVEFHTEGNQAHLTGMLKYSQGPGSHDYGSPIGLVNYTDSTWQLDVWFTEDTSDGTVSNPDLRYFHMNSGTLTRKNGIDEYFDLFERPDDGSKPFIAGQSTSDGPFGDPSGPIPNYKCAMPEADGSCLSAAGWLSWNHYIEGTLVNEYWDYPDTSDFLMQLKPIPEPTSAALFGIGSLLVAGAVVRRKTPRS